MWGRKVAVWTATNRCNLDCGFCFGREEKAELGTEGAERLIVRAAEVGARYFVFSGGEPLLRKDIFGLADCAKKCGMKTVLHTNGVLVNEGNAGRIAGHFDRVNLPVDGADERANRLMGRGSLAHTLEVIGMLDGKCEIVVSTVATKLNLKEVPEIGELLEGRGIAKWRIFRFNPKAGRARQNAEAFGIADGDFAGLKGKIRANGLKAEFVGPEGWFEQSYWMVSSDGGTQGQNFVNFVRICK